MITLPRSMRLTVPDSRLSCRSRKSLRICSRSASRIFWRMTCFAACAPMRPNSTGSSGSSTTSPERERRIALERVGDRDLARRLLVLLVGHDRPAPERLVVAGLAVDLDARLDVVGILLLGRRRERRLERGEDDVLGDVLLARQRVHQQQQFAISHHFLHSIFGTSRARPMSAKATDSMPVGVSTSTLSPSIPRSVPLTLRLPATGARRRSSASSPAKRV